MSISTQSGQAMPEYKIHWHVVLIHFPISFYLVAFMFMLIYLFTSSSCFEMTSVISLLAGFVMIIPAIITGWFTWKNKYKGFRGMLFKRKIITSFVMIGISFVLVVGQVVNTGFFEHSANAVWHGAYFIGTALLIIGAGIEGFYGGRLNHK